jgi:hypothetical protein
LLAEVFAIPEYEERDYLIAGLARLVQQRGPEQLLQAPLLLAEPQFWPDKVETRGQAAAVLLRRLLSYAGMGDLGVEIEIGGARPQLVVDDGAEHEDPLHHAAGWFLGIEGGVCRFGVSDASLRDKQMLIGTLGHEVAHAYREHHQLVVPTHDVEEQLTDLTTIYLGFGYFTLQSAFQFKTGHYDDRGQQLLYERQMLGYLRPGQLALLLAAQLVVRSRDDQELRPLLRALAPNQSEALLNAYRELEPQREKLRVALGVAHVEHLPRAPDLKEFVKPLGPAVVRINDHAAEQRVRAENGKFAFRVRHSRKLLGAATGSVLGFSSVFLGADLWMWLLLPVFAAIGYRIGGRLRAQSCSECNHGVDESAEVCSFCDTPLVGSIDDINDRLEAEDIYRATHGAS